MALNEMNLQEEYIKLKDKLHRAMRRMEGLKEKSKLLEMQYTDSKEREQHTQELVMELLERQRELNVMLNRANIMLNRTQEAMALTSLEFNEMAKALPEPKKAEWSDRVAKINDLFKKTGIQDAEIVGLESSNQLADPFAKDEMLKESEQAFGRKDSIWNRKENTEPPRIEARIVEETDPEEAPAVEPEFEPVHIAASVSDDIPQPQEEISDLETKRRTWWQKITAGT